MSGHDQPTLLIFTLGPGREQARRRWLRGGFEDLGRQVHQCCLDEVLEAGRAADCALRLCTPAGELLARDAVVDPQAEGGFGPRFLTAMERADRESEGPLIVVGTDTPGVDSKLLRRVLDELEADPDGVVLGPAADGGIYLLAAARPVTGDLAGVLWQSSHTLASLLAVLRAAGRPVRLLPRRHDLDSRRDLEIWVARGFAATLGSRWRAILAALRTALVRQAFAFSGVPAPALVPAWRHVSAGRAPPR